MIASLPSTSVATRRAASAPAIGIAERILGWYRAARDRRQLAALSDHMLRDVGLTRADVDREALQPFWKPVDYAALERQRRLAWRRTPVTAARR